MSRRKIIRKRLIDADPKYSDLYIAKFINVIMMRGKKSIAEKILYGALKNVESIMNVDPIKIFRTALNNVKPELEVRSKRIGGTNYQIPVEVRMERGIALSYRWIRDCARKRGELTMKDKLGAEIIDAANVRGNAYKMKEDMHKMAAANKAFAHYRW